MKIELKPQRRKTIGLYPRPGGVLEVRHPVGMAKSEINLFIEKHRAWAEEALSRKEAEASAELTARSRLPFLGRDYPIFPPENGKTGFFPGLGFRLPKEQAAERALEIYRTAAKTIIPGKVEAAARRMGVDYCGVKINSAKTRWGSCSGKNSLNFSLYLMLAPEPAVDYVVVHELAHTVHHDHSREFWALVERFCPDFTRQKAVLDECAKKRRLLGI